MIAPVIELYFAALALLNVVWAVASNCSDGQAQKDDLMAGRTAQDVETLAKVLTADGEREKIVAELTGIWQNLLGVPSIAPDQNYFELGGDSPLAVQLFTRIEKAFHVKLPLATLFEAPTIDELSQILGQDARGSAWSSLVPIQSVGSRPILFCVHPHGGNVLVYRALSRHLGYDQPFYGLQAQGLDGSSKPLTRIEDMAARYVKDIRRVQPHGPYFLGGYCMGGAIAYEMAQQLLASGETTALVAMFDTMNWEGTSLLSLWEKFIYNCERTFFHIENFLSLNASAKRVFFREKVQTLRGRIPVFWSTLVDKFSGHHAFETNEARVLGEIWRANLKAYMDYSPKPYRGPVTDIRPAKQYRSCNKSELKWERLAQGGQEITVLPVNAPAILTEPFVKHLAGVLRVSIDKAADKVASEKNVSGLAEVRSPKRSSEGAAPMASNAKIFTARHPDEAF